MASGIFIVPFLTLFQGINTRSAVACSVVSVIACSCASAAPFLRGGLTNIRIAIVLETATTLGALTDLAANVGYAFRAPRPAASAAQPPGMLDATPRPRP